jgi:hypothetical protein
MVPVTMTARITSTWRSVIICPKPQPYAHRRGPPAFGIVRHFQEPKPQVESPNAENLPVFDIGYKSLFAMMRVWRSNRSDSVGSEPSLGGIASRLGKRLRAQHERAQEVWDLEMVNLARGKAS